MTNARIGYGTTYEIFYSGGYVAVGEVFDAVPGTPTTDRVDATHYQSPGKRREKISGLIDSGDGSFQINWVPGDATDLMLRALLASGANVNHKITFPNGVTLVYAAAITGYDKGIPIDDRMVGSITVSVSGDETWGSASAPTNSVLPAISGIAQVGHVMTAWPGVWTGAPSFTYQWEGDGTPIVGAASSTYTPVEGDIADAITVVVTATNSAGSASAESIATADVIAA